MMIWHTDTDRIEHGSWFWGTLYPDRMDLSWDGKYLVYLAASDDNRDMWSGVCVPPKLTTLVHWSNCAVYAGGGFFDRADHLQIYDYELKSSPIQTMSKLPFTAAVYRPTMSALGYGVMKARLTRNGWLGVEEYDGSPWQIPKEDQLAWTNQPTTDHPVLRCWDRGIGWSKRSHRYDYQLESHPELLDRVQMADWDCLGQLLVARAGCLERYTLDDLKQESPTPSFTLDLNPLESPRKQA